ncbi:MAG: beta-ketoacyl-ACP synthase 3 [Thermoleophilaceae bacterium]|nr:beta-ketoacyl-ACP synthase 3 [Thermoleophilaceae bacterium]
MTMSVIETSPSTSRAARRELRTAGMLGYGCAQPSKIVTSEEIAARYDLTADWIIERTGVESRCVLDLDKGETLLDLVVTASRDALEVAGRSAEEVDTVIVATITPDHLFPAESVALAAAIGVPQRAVVYDLSAACTGFVTALGQAAGAVESGRSELALVVGADALSRITPFDDPKGAPLFGDAAGAVVVGPVEHGGIGPIVAGYDHQHRILFSDRDDDNVIRMRGRETYTHAVSRMSEVILESLAQRGATLDDVALLVPHQANIRIVRAVGEKLGIPSDRVSTQIADVGNTSAASIPFALSREYKAGRLADGGLIAMAGFGGGFVYSAITVEIEGIAP